VPGAVAACLGTKNPPRESGANYLIGHLCRGVTIQQVRAEMTALWPAVRAASVPPGLTPAEHEEMKNLGLRVEPAGTGFSLWRPDCYSAWIRQIR
jgi:hypothetical protein